MFTKTEITIYREPNARDLACAAGYYPLWPIAKALWRRLPLYLGFLLLSILLFATLADVQINSVASVYFISGMVSYAIFRFLPKVSRPKAGVRYACEGIHASLMKWRSMENKYGPFEEDWAKTGREVELVAFKLERQLKMLKKAGWREKMGMLHWGTCAVIAYDGEYRELGRCVRDIELIAMRRAYTRSRLVHPISGPTQV
ncbi:hypothetical protein B0H11DRAFT_1998224 [Mycena galericulata]|nr:hypothetical protein B0H11DRAFT_1998224 [Mycena galericulata]